jgi:rhamnosyltransferase
MPDQPGESTPTISIALLVKNGMPKLQDLLASLRAQRDCPPFEIVAVDSGSTDGSLEAMQNQQVRVTRIPPESFRFGTTRQMVFGLTRGQVIVTMSQDTLPANDQWLSAMTRPILDGQCDVVGATECAPQQDQLKLVILNNTFTYKHWSEPFINISCAGMAISRNSWEQTGFGDVKMSEDKYIGTLLQQKQFRMRMCDQVPLLHGHAYTFSGYVKRAFNEGMGARDTGGFYSFGCLLRDIFSIGRYRMTASAVIKHRALTIIEASWFPLRPVFLYLGWRFGKKYWH